MIQPRVLDARDSELPSEDQTLLRELYESRIMTVDHIAAVIYSGRKQTAYKTVQRLKSSGFLRERPRRPNEPSILFLGFKGYDFVRKHFGEELPKIPWAVFSRRVQVSELTLRHELAVLDLKGAFMTAVQNQEDLFIDSFSTWPRLHQFSTHDKKGEINGSPRKRLTKPDGFLRLTDTKQLITHRFFLEADRSTETLDTLVSKALAYSDYYRSGNFAAIHGHPPADYRKVPFRVLMVFRNEERRNNVAERLLLHAPPLLTQFWLSTFEQVQRDALGPSWIRPVDYRDALHGTEFEPNVSNLTCSPYRRNSARERLVSQRITMHPLLDNSSASEVHPHLPFPS